MNEDTLVAVSGYLGDIHQVEQNLSLYLHHRCPVLVLSPADAPIISVSNPDVHCAWVGRREWAGAKSLDRHVEYLKILWAMPQNWFLFHDSDSVCLESQLPQCIYAEKAAWSNEVRDLNIGKSHLEKIACQPPYFFHREVLRQMLEVSSSPPPSYYGEITGDPVVTSCIDHFHWQLTAGCGFPHHSFLNGASWETESESGLREMARIVRYEGKTFIHSVKSKRALDRLIAEREFYVSRH